jgi:AbrB family looped-hinge helix DNA binding protein
MSSPATTRMSSKGQVVIPEEIRDRLGLTAGIQFVVIGDNGVVILKALAPPKMSDFEELVGHARRQARKVGLKRSDIAKAVKAEKKAK